jgi:hypothetical protein
LNSGGDVSGLAMHQVCSLSRMVLSYVKMKILCAPPCCISQADASPPEFNLWDRASEVWTRQPRRGVGASGEHGEDERASTEQCPVSSDMDG